MSSELAGEEGGVRELEAPAVHAQRGLDLGARDHELHLARPTLSDPVGGEATVPPFRLLGRVDRVTRLIEAISIKKERQRGDKYKENILRGYLSGEGAKLSSRVAKLHSEREAEPGGQVGMLIK